MPFLPKETVQRLSRNFPAQLRAFDQVRTLIEEFSAAAGLNREDRHKLTLIVEELFTNTVNHGFRGDSDSVISVSFEQSDEGVHLTYEDSAPPYDPLAAISRFDIEPTISQRLVGGLGVFLAVGLAHRTHYSFVDGRNRISLTLARGRE